MPDDEPRARDPEGPELFGPHPEVSPKRDQGTEPGQAPAAPDERAHNIPPGNVPPENIPPGNIPPGVATASGAYTIWVADQFGKEIDPLKNHKVRDKEPNPSLPNAVDIAYELLDLPQLPPEEQVALQLDIDKVLRTVSQLYLESTPVQPDKFRTYFVRLFRIAQLGLEGQNAVPGVARGALAAVTTELIDDEAGRIKNAHMRELGFYAGAYSLVCFALYSVIHLYSAAWFTKTLTNMQAQKYVIANFAVLWIGCFIGVWLSYGVRKSTFALVDLTRFEEDRLVPQLRLIFAGLLTTIVGLLLALGFVDVTVGEFSFQDLTKHPMVALLIGLFCGVSELSLPASIGTRAQNFIKSVI